MILICGTVPKRDLPLTLGEASFEGESLIVKGSSGAIEIPCTQGTAALASAACVTSEVRGCARPHVLLVGDDGTGKGSRLLYDHLIRNLPSIGTDVLLMHYILPVMGLMRRVCESAEKCRPKPFMMADASSMYAAKAAGLAPRFDLFTPDFCEMAFLADPEATHPAYVSRHLFCAEIADIDALIAAACKNKNAARTMIVKGKTDHIVENGKVLERISEPDIPALEAIGGTGDTISGIIGALVGGKIPAQRAAVIAARANRLAGKYASARPSTKIREVVENLPHALAEIMKGE